MWTNEERELIAGFNEAMRRREQEMRTQINEMSSVVLAHEMKVGVPQSFGKELLRVKRWI